MDTNMLNLNELVESSLVELWKTSFCKAFTEHPAIYQKQVRKNLVTFLSLNPSLSPDDKRELKNEGKCETEKECKIEERLPKPIDMIDCNAQRLHPFYKKYIDIANAMKSDEFKEWAALDLFYMRDSNQSNIAKIYQKRKDDPFLIKQVELTLNVIEKLAPKLVVVSNRLVQKILTETGIKADADNIYKYKDIPFIMDESGFMGSRFLCYPNSKKGKELREILYNRFNSARLQEILTRSA